MATVQQANDILAVVHEVMETMDSKIDEVRVAFAALKEQIGAGGPVTQDQLDALVASLESLRVKASERLAEVDAIDE